MSDFSCLLLFFIGSFIVSVVAWFNIVQIPNKGFSEWFHTIMGGFIIIWLIICIIGTIIYQIEVGW